jgi:hypothetical protein
MAVGVFVAGITCGHEENTEKILTAVEPCESVLVAHTMPCDNHALYQFLAQSRR